MELDKTWLRRQSEDPDLWRILDEAPPEPGIPASVVSRIVGAALDRLPPRYRLPVWLRHGEAIPVETVATMLSAAPDRVRVRAQKGMTMLKQRLSRLTGAPFPDRCLMEGLSSLSLERAPSRLLNRLRYLSRRPSEFF